MCPDGCAWLNTFVHVYMMDRQVNTLVHACVYVYMMGRQVNRLIYWHQGKQIDTVRQIDYK